MRSTVARRVRLPLRTLARAPDDLGAALVAFGRALRAHRRLARLAPQFFDSAVVDRERRQCEAQRRWRAEWEPVLAKVYGTEPTPAPAPAADLPPLPPPRVQRAVERDLALWKFWLESGRLALERHCRRRPHALVRFSRITRLLELGFAFGRLACGADSDLPQPEPELDPYQQARADLERAYGHLSRPASSTAGAPAPPDASPLPPPTSGDLR